MVSTEKAFSGLLLRSKAAAISQSSQSMCAIACLHYFKLCILIHQFRSFYRQIISLHPAGNSKGIKITPPILALPSVVVRTWLAGEMGGMTWVSVQ